jgi:hypothetical protein
MKQQPPYPDVSTAVLVIAVEAEAPSVVVTAMKSL